MAQLHGGGVQWKNAEVMRDGDRLVLRVPAYIDQRATEHIEAGLTRRLREELRYAVTAGVTPGNPGAITIAGLKEPGPNPGFLSKAARDAIDEAYALAGEDDAAAR